MGEAGLEGVGMVEDAESEVKVALAADHGDKAPRVEAIRPWLDGGSDAVGFEELRSGVGDGGEVIEVDSRTGEVRESDHGRESPEIRRGSPLHAGDSSERHELSPPALN